VCCIQNGNSISTVICHRTYCLIQSTLQLPQGGTVVPTVVVGDVGTAGVVAVVDAIVVVVVVVEGVVLVVAVATHTWTTCVCDNEPTS